MDYLKLRYLMCILISEVYVAYGYGCIELSTSVEDCHVDATCEEIVELNQLYQSKKYQSYKYKQCSNLGNNGMESIYLTYKQSELISDSDIPNFDFKNMNNIKSMVVQLNVQNNEYKTMPNITSLDHLRLLNLSHNIITSAKFSNREQLQLLINLDLSHNNIDNFVNVPNEYTYSSLLHLNISNNYLTNIPDGTFDSLRSLLSLDLSRNFIDILGVMTFDGIKQLIILNLSYNRIADLNMSLLRFIELEQLFLNHNMITTLSITDFKSLMNLRTLDLKHNLILNIEPNVFDKMFNINLIDLSNNLIDHVTNNIFYNNTYLETVYFSYNKLTALPGGIFKGKNVTNFSIEGNKIEGSISREMFDGLSKLIELNLNEQNVFSIDDYTFNGCKNIMSLYMKKNKVSSIAANSFRSLYKLITLDLSQNKLTNIGFDKTDLISLETLLLNDNFISYAKKEDFEHLTHLQYLDLTNNNISRVEQQTFHFVKNLINLKISNNPLAGAIVGDAFEGLSALPNLDISQTNLNLIKNCSFRGMTTLKKLNVSKSGLNCIEYNAFYDTGMIEVIDLSNNFLTVFEINGETLPNLNSLILNNNNLTTLSSKTLKHLNSLVKLYISSNDLSYIEPNAFNDSIGIQYLDLSYNRHLSINSSLELLSSLYYLTISGTKCNIVLKNTTIYVLSKFEISHSNITKINELKLQNLKQLYSMDLTYNSISKIEGDAFFSMNRLQILNLSFNDISYIQPNAFKDNEMLHTLNISHNSLVSLNFGTFRGLYSLSKLDLSYNQLNNLKSERFYEVSSLSTLIIDHNNIVYVGENDFEGTSLTQLSIGENPIPCEILISLKKRVGYALTSIKKDYVMDNSDGVICKGETDRAFPAPNTTISRNFGDVQILKDIKDILINSSLQDNAHLLPLNAREIILQLFNNISGQFKENTDSLKNVTDNTNKITRTNFLLEQILKAIPEPNSNTDVKPKIENSIVDNNLHNIVQKLTDAMTSEFEKNKSDSHNNYNIFSNITQSTINNEHNSDDLIKKNDLDKIVQKFEATMISQKTEILKEVNDKMNGLHRDRNYFESVQSTKEKLSSNEEVTTKASSIFTEVCVALILSIMICFILYKFYKSGMFVPQRRSESTGNIPSAMENSAL